MTTKSKFLFHVKFSSEMFGQYNLHEKDEMLYAVQQVKKTVPHILVLNTALKFTPPIFHTFLNIILCIPIRNYCILPISNAMQ
jgi:hypothetical protein